MYGYRSYLELGNPWHIQHTVMTLNTDAAMARLQ